MVELTRERLPEVVAEVDRLAQQRGGVLDRADAEGVLRELGLPSDLLDDAMAEIARREEARRKKRKTMAVVLALSAIAAGIVAFVVVRGSARHDELTKITGRDAHLSRDEADKVQVTEVVRDGRDVYYDVTLLGAPHGRSLPMRCTWTDPSGTLARESRYDTKTVDRDAWPTHCKTRIGQESPSGSWKVKMDVEGRQVAETSFDVK